MSAVDNLKDLKRPQKGANLKNIRKWPLNDLKVQLRGQNDLLWSNGWFYWIQEVKTYRKWGIDHHSSCLTFFFGILGKINIIFTKMAKNPIFLEFIFCYLLISLMGHHNAPKKCYGAKLGGGAWGPPVAPSLLMLLVNDLCVSSSKSIFL